MTRLLLLVALPAAPALAQPGFTRHDIGTDLAGPWGTAVADLDGDAFDGANEAVPADLDGDLDVVGVAVEGGVVVWWENLAVVAVEPGSEAATGLVLLPNHPNPFRDRTTIRYRLDGSADVELAVYDALGRRVATLVRGRLPAGDHTAVWEGTDAAGRPLAAGVYLCRFAAGAGTQTRRLLLLR